MSEHPPDDLESQTPRPAATGRVDWIALAKELEAQCAALQAENEKLMRMVNEYFRGMADEGHKRRMAEAERDRLVEQVAQLREALILW